MNKLLLALTLSSTMSSFANTHEFEGEGRLAEQVIDSEKVAVGDRCSVKLVGSVLTMFHNAAIEGWDVGDREVGLDLSLAKSDGGVYKVKESKSSRGYCGDHQSAHGLVRYMKKEGNIVTYGERYRCTFDISKTTHEHNCQID